MLQTPSPSQEEATGSPALSKDSIKLRPCSTSRMIFFCGKVIFGIEANLVYCRGMSDFTQNHQNQPNIRWALLGSSRGLGWETYKLLQQNPQNEFFLSSRKIKERESLSQGRSHFMTQDFSRLPLDASYIEKLQSFSPQHLIYFAGGGPYGIFQSKKWEDHEWCLNVSFLYPAQLLHHILRSSQLWAGLKSMTLIGSSVAEDKPDPQAASYAAAKHALKGLVESVQCEQSLPFRVQLYSPGYMQTDLLPANSKPRLADRAEKPELVARLLIEYIEKQTE